MLEETLLSLNFGSYVANRQPFRLVHVGETRRSVKWFLSKKAKLCISVWKIIFDSSIRFENQFTELLLELNIMELGN